MIHARERQQVAYFMRRLYQLRLTTTSGGNVSVRVGADRFAITASSTDKARARACEVAVIDFDGRNLTPELTPSPRPRCTYGSTRNVRRSGPSATPIRRTWPPSCARTPSYASTCSRRPTLVDEPVVVPYYPRAPRSWRSVRGRALSSILMRNHAATATGRILLQAFNRIELLEDAARLSLRCLHLPGVTGLSPTHRRELDQQHR